MMGHCADCRWWWQEDETQCIGECELGGTKDGFEQHHPETLAYAWVNHHKVTAETFLITRANFGCVQFMPKGE
jgi:hypothetical protein